MSSLLNIGAVHRTLRLARRRQSGNQESGAEAQAGHVLTSVEQNFVSMLRSHNLVPFGPESEGCFCIAPDIGPLAIVPPSPTARGPPGGPNVSPLLSASRQNLAGASTTSSPGEASGKGSTQPSVSVNEPPLRPFAMPRTLAQVVPPSQVELLQGRARFGGKENTMQRFWHVPG